VAFEASSASVAPLPDSLAGIRAKLERCEEHLKTLDREITRFLEHKPYVTTGHFNAERSSYIFRFQPIKRPPVAWGVTVGEVVHHLRSALDHLVWQLVKLNEREPGRWSSFPIYRKAPKAGFAKVAQGCGKHRGPLYGVGAEALTRIKLAQPYNGGDCRLLAVLDDIWQADKHRFLMPTFLMVSPLAHLEARYTPNADAGPVMKVGLIQGGAVEDGAELVEIGLSPTGPDPKVSMQGDLSIGIAFSGGIGVLDALEEITRFVAAGVFGPLAELFSF